MRSCFCLAFGLSAMCVTSVRADVVYQHTAYSPAGLAMSSWWEPDDNDNDTYTWDAFTIPAGGEISEVRWRGGYTYGGNYGHVTGFVIGFWPSLTCCNEPDLYAHPVEYSVRGLAGETPVGTYNGIAMYEYVMTIDPPFVAEPGVKYWIQIEGSKTNIPDWGLAWGQGGDGSNYRFTRGLHMYQTWPHDAMFTLLGAGACKADFNGDGAVNTLDMLAFLNAWSAGDPGGDFDGNGTINTLDVLAFLNAWSAGC